MPLNVAPRQLVHGNFGVTSYERESRPKRNGGVNHDPKGAWRDRDGGRRINGSVHHRQPEAPVHNITTLLAAELTSERADAARQRRLDRSSPATPKRRPGAHGLQRPGRLRAVQRRSTTPTWDLIIGVATVALVLGGGLAGVYAVGDFSLGRASLAWLLLGTLAALVAVNLASPSSQSPDRTRG